MERDLVAQDYYAQELKYQDRIDAVHNEKSLAVSIMHEIQQDKVVLFYFLKEPASPFSGEIVFFRPSDSTKDLKLKMKFDETGRQFISKKALSKGVYKLCLSWNNNGIEYYKEEVITL